MSDNIVRVGVGLYIYNENGEVFLMHRTGKHGNGTWCPPGGHQDFGESFLEAAKREAKEETNLDIDLDAINLVKVTNDFHTSENKHYVTLHMETRSFSGAPKIMEPNKFSKMGWFNQDNLPEPLFLPCGKYFKDKKQASEEAFFYSLLVPSNLNISSVVSGLISLSSRSKNEVPEASGVVSSAPSVTENSSVLSKLIRD